MRREIEMPRLSDAVEEGVLVTWFVELGATVREGDRVAEVQVEKVTSEIHAPAAGRIGELLVEPGGVVSQGATIAILETEGEGAQAQAGTAGAGVLASPAARRLARELGVDLTAVAGSGPGGRIVEADVRAASTAAGASTVPAAGRTEPISSMRHAIADRLRAGLASTAQLTLTAEADLTVLAARLDDWSASRDRRASFAEAIVRAVALALREHPRLAARWEGDRLAHPDRIDIGVAVALADGLIVPVVRDADRKDLPTLGREIAELAQRARVGALVPSETEGACFSVTNLGGHRIDAFTPLLNPPQTAILGIGRARLRPAVFDGAIVPRVLTVLSLTFDHQVVDGAPAAAFLEAVVELLEAPDGLTT